MTSPCVDALAASTLRAARKAETTGVDHHLHERLAQLAERAAVAERTAEVQLELLHAPERGEDREVVETALAVVELRSAPDAAPAVLGHEALEVAVEVVGALHGAIDVLGAQHLTALCQAEIQQLVIHSAPPIGLVVANARLTACGRRQKAPADGGGCRHLGAHQVRCAPGPLTPSKLRLLVEGHPLALARDIGIQPRHIEQPAFRHSKPASANTIEPLGLGGALPGHRIRHDEPR